MGIVGFPKFTQKIGYGANTRVGASMKPTPQAMYEYGTWVVTSKHFDDVIRPELEDLAKKMKDAREHSQTEGVKFIDPIINYKFKMTDRNYKFWGNGDKNDI